MPYRTVEILVRQAAKVEFVPLLCDKLHGNDERTPSSAVLELRVPTGGVLRGSSQLPLLLIPPKAGEQF